WTANGFLVGQQIAISGSALNGTGKGLFTITHVTATVITLSAGDTIKAEASAATAETVTVRRAATITRTDALGSWINDGFIVGQAITVVGSTFNNTAAGQTFTIAAVTGNVITLSVGDAIRNEASPGSPETVTVKHDGTITRTDGGDWTADGFAAGQLITVSGSAANSTAAGQTFKITTVTAGVITLSPANAIVTEGTSGTPETITVVANTAGTINRTTGSWIDDGFAIGQTIVVGGSALNTTDTVTTTAAYFTASVGGTPGTITRTAGNWITDGFAVGQVISVSGSSANSTGASLFTVTAVTGTVITLSAADTIAAEASSGTP